MRLGSASPSSTALCLSQGWVQPLPWCQPDTAVSTAQSVLFPVGDIPVPCYMILCWASNRHLHCCCCSVTSVVSDSVRPHRRQPPRLCRPWGSPGKNTGVGCHFLLQCMKVKSESKVAQTRLTLRNPMVCSPPVSSVHGIFQARVLEWVPLPSPSTFTTPVFHPVKLTLPFFFFFLQIRMNFLSVVL